MKSLLIWFVCWLVLSSCPSGSAAEVPGSKSKEPVYQGQPLGYWLEGLGKWDKRAAEASKAVKTLGMPALPFILQFACTNDAGVVNQSDTGRAVYRACRLLDEGKPNRAVTKALRIGMNSSEPQVRMNAIAGVPVSDHFKGDLEKLTRDTSLQVRQAASNALTHLERYDEWRRKQQATGPAPSLATPKRSK